MSAKKKKTKQFRNSSSSAKRLLEKIENNINIPTITNDIISTLEQNVLQPLAASKKEIKLFTDKKHAPPKQVQIKDLFPVTLQQIPTKATTKPTIKEKSKPPITAKPAEEILIKESIKIEDTIPEHKKEFISKKTLITKKAETIKKPITIQKKTLLTKPSKPKQETKEKELTKQKVEEKPSKIAKTKPVPKEPGQQVKTGTQLEAEYKARQKKIQDVFKQDKGSLT